MVNHLPRIFHVKVLQVLISTQLVITCSMRKLKVIKKLETGKASLIKTIISFHGFRIREVLLYSVENARLGPPMYLGFQSWWCGEEQVTSLIYVVSFLSRVSHTNIVKLFETYDDKTRVYLVMEM